jgi:hypothetical protein
VDKRQRLRVRIAAGLLSLTIALSPCATLAASGSGTQYTGTTVGVTCQFVRDGVGTVHAVRRSFSAPDLLAIRIGGSIGYFFAYRPFSVNQSVTVSYYKCWTSRSAAFLRILTVTPFN